VRDALRYIGEQRTTDTPFDFINIGVTPAEGTAAAEVVGPFADAGATWWVELIGPFRGTLDEMRARITAGPPGI
jgi:hypothetical protein